MAAESVTVTISELKMFIKAVEFATDDDEWIPSKRQWYKIREMIDQLQESKPTPAPAPAPAPAPQVMQLPMPMNHGPAQFAPSAMAMNPTQLAPRVPNGNAPFASDMPASPVRTPSVDTSNGSYQTPFT